MNTTHLPSSASTPLPFQPNHLAIAAHLKHADQWQAENLVEIIQLAKQHHIKILTIAICQPCGEQREKLEQINKAHVQELQRFVNEQIKAGQLTADDLQIHISYECDDRERIATKLKKNISAHPTTLNIGPLLSTHMHHHQLAKPDLILFTGYDLTLLNLLSWQSSHTEYLFIKTSWPRLNAETLHSALEQFRPRRPSPPQNAWA